MGGNKGADAAGHSGSSAALNDFGDRFGPVLVKELRQGLRARRFVGPFLLVQFVAIIAVLGEAAVVEIETGAAVFGIGSGLLMQIIGLALGLLMPLTGFAALRPELDRSRNVELLLLANLSRWQIALGKWLVMSSLAGLILVSLLPYLLARHFIGGIDLVWSLSFVGGIWLLNLTMNAAVVGASGFSNVIARLVVLGITAGSGLITMTTVMIPLLTSSISTFSDYSLLEMALHGALSLIVAALYCAFGLQIARAKLRLFENPVDPPASGLLIAMMIFTPLLVGIFSVAGAYAPPVICLLLLGAVLAIDRGPGKKYQPGYAQP